METRGTVADDFAAVPGEIGGGFVPSADFVYGFRKPLSKADA